MTAQQSPAAPPASAAAKQMTAVVHRSYGTVPADVLRLEQVDTPTISPDELLVRVHAASVDRGTWHIMAGLPYPIRAAGFGVRKPKHLNPGRSLAGTVEAVGSDVAGFAPGNEVFGIGDGSFAQHVRVRPEKLAAKPANVSFEEAAAVPISGLTALQAVRDHGGVTSGQTVLILGASGGVGSFAVQIAKARGAQVTGVCSTAKVDLVRAFGADHVIDYTRDDVVDDRHRYDVILDIAGNRRLSHLRRALASDGTLVIVGGETAGRWLGGTHRQIGAVLLSRFVEQRLGTFISSENAGDLVALRELIESGEVSPALDRTYPLSATAAAIDHVVHGHARGKVAITI